MSFNKVLPKNSQKSLFSPVLEELKRPVMISFPLILLFKTISTIQVLSLMLEIANNFFKHNEGRWGMTDMIRAFIFKDIFTVDHSNTVTSIVYILCWIAILLHYILLVCVFTAIQLKISKVYKLAVVLKKYMIFHQFVLFLPIHTFMLEIIKACSDSKAGLFGTSYDSLFFSIGILLVLLNFVAGFISLKCYSPLYAQKTFTKRNSNLAFIDLIYKACLSSYIVFISATVSAKWIAITSILIYIVVSHYFFHSQLPFFQIKVLEAYCTLLGTKISFGLAIFLTGIFDEFRPISVPDLPLVAFMFSLPLCVRGQLYKMEKTILKATIFDERNYKSENDVFIHLLAIRYLFKKGAFVTLKLSKHETTNWNMILNGVITRHSDTCDNSMCVCRTFLETDDSHKGSRLKKEKYKELEIILMRDLYEKGAERVPHSELILLNLAQFYLLYLENYLRSYLVLQAFEKKNQKSFETEILVEYLKKRIQERMELKLSGNGQQGLIGDYEPNNLNVTALVQNDILFIQLKKLIHDQVGKQLKFWDMLDNFELNTKSIENCCEEIDSVRSKIEKLWDSLVKINQKCTSHYFLYGLYQTIVNNTTKRGERFLNDYTRMHGVSAQDQEGVTNDNLYDQNTVVIRLSMRRDKMGTIEECSGDIETIFGYQGSELIENNVATIMSAFFKERHQNFLINHFEKGTENALNKIKRLFGYHKDGHIFPLFLYISIYPNVETGLSYLGIIRPRKVYNNYILLKSDGTVDSYSPEIADYLGLDSRKKYSIAELCPDFEKINNSFNYVTNTKYENLKDDLVEFRSDSLAKKSADYQIKVSHQLEAPDALDQALLKKGIGSLVSDYEGTDSRVIPSIDTKDEPSQLKAKEKGVSFNAKSMKVKNSNKRIRRLNTEDIDEYKRVYDQFTISGSVLSFISQKDKLASLKNYLCTVSDEICDFSILRVITLGRNDENADATEKDVERSKDVLKSELLDIQDVLSSKKEVSSYYDQDDIGISKMPNYEEMELFRNPFGTIEAEVEQKPKSETPKRTHEASFKFLQTHLETNEQPLQQVNTINPYKYQDTYEKPFNNKVTDLNEIKDSEYMVGNDGKYKADFNDSREFIQGMIQADSLLEKFGGPTTSVSMKGGITSKLEALLYKREEGRASTKLKSYYVIITACIILAIFNITITNNSLKEGSNEVQRLLSVAERINVLLDLTFNSRILFLHLNDYISPTRHLEDQGIANYAEVAFENIRDEAESLIDMNAIVMNNICSLHSSFQPKFYSNLVTLKYPSTEMGDNNIKKLNIFEAVDTVALSGLEIASRSLDTLDNDSEHIKYILLNSMNEVYLELQNGYKIYEDDQEETLSGIRAITWGIAITVFSLYIVFMAILIRDLAHTHQDKIRFWNSLIKLDTVKHTSHKKLLVIIKENLEHSSNHSLLKKALIETKRNGLKEIKASKAKETQANNFKKLKNYKLNNRSYLIIFPFLLVLAIILAFFILCETFVVEGMENKKNYMQEIKQSGSYYQLNFLTLNGIYEFVSEGGSTYLEGSPIEDTIVANLDTLSKLGDFISSFKVRPSFDPKEFIQMNICETYIAESERSQCFKDGSGINAQGLLGVLTFAKETMESVMDFARTSDGTIANIQMALKQNNLITLETELKYISEGFKILSKSIAQSELSEQEDFETQQIVMLLAFIICLMVLNYFLVWKSFKKLDGQKFDNMKILRVIPAFMIFDSKMLKTYLLKSFKDDLSSITNKL